MGTLFMGDEISEPSGQPVVETCESPGDDSASQRWRRDYRHEQGRREHSRVLLDVHCLDGALVREPAGNDSRSREEIHH